MKKIVFLLLIVKNLYPCPACVGRVHEHSPLFFSAEADREISLHNDHIPENTSDFHNEKENTQKRSGKDIV